MNYFFKHILLLLFFTLSLNAQEKVVLQLKWFHQFQFAGYYAAKEKGFYDEVGLDVEIRERDLLFNNIEQVTNNEAQYGVADSMLILYKAQKQPVVIVSPVLQHSLGVLMALKSSGISSPYDLNNKDVIFYPNDTDGFSILAMFKKLNVKPNLIRRRAKDDYIKLMNGEVDLSPAYLSNEPFHFYKKDIELNIINPMNYGFDLYGDMLFTNENEAKNHPDRVRRFKDATLKGWEYALDNQDEIVQLIKKKYNKTKSIKHLKYEAQAIAKVISRDTIPLGSLDKGRIKYISDLYKEHGLIQDEFKINDFVFEEFTKRNSFNLTEEEILYLEQNPILKVQNLMSFPPYNFYEDKPLGYTIDYMNIIGKLLKVEIEFISGKALRDYLDMIQRDELDIIPHLAINEEREKFISFTTVEHINYQTSLGVRKGSQIKSFEDLKDKTLAVLDKSFLHTIIKEKFPKQKLFTVPTIKEGVEAVSRGQVDAIIDNLATIEYYKNKNWLSNLDTIRLHNIDNIPENTMLYMGVKKNNLLLKSILEKVEKAIPYSEILNLKEKWLNINPSTTVKWSDEEIKYIKQKDELKMCIDPNWLPFEKIEDGKHIGMTAEYIKLFEKELNVPINLQITKNWLESIKKARNRECDFISIMTKSVKRQKDFNFTESLMEMPLVVATKVDKPFINDIKNVLDKKLGIVKGFPYSEILKKKYPDLQIIEVKNAFDGLSLVNENRLYGFIGVLPVIGLNIQEHFVGNLKVTGKLKDSTSFTMATRNDEPILNDIFNKLIKNISYEKNQEILNKWLSIKYERNIDYKTIFYIVLVFIIILLIVSFKNRAISGINFKLSKYIKVVDEHVLTSSTNLDGNITEVSQAFCEISGYTKEELLGENHNIIRHEDMPEKLFKELWETISSGEVWKGEILNKKKNGKAYWVDAIISPLFDERNKIIGYTAIRHDITDKKRIEEISIRDELTTLYNKRYFNEMFEKEINRAKRDTHAFGFIILDVDCFKQYNDFYGHQKGDYVLECIGKELQNICKRSADIPYRIGGEEFAVTFRPYFKEDAEEFAKLINKRIEALQIEHKYNKAADVITVSIGLYIAAGEKIASAKEIYNFADNALYEAKEKGRNQYITFSPKS